MYGESHKTATGASQTHVHGAENDELSAHEYPSHHGREGLLLFRCFKATGETFLVRTVLVVEDSISGTHQRSKGAS